MKTPKQSYTAFRNGDHLSDDELLELFSIINTIAENCSVLGDEWYLASSKAFHDLHTLRTYIIERGIYCGE
jgi:hypothetical protein